MTGNVLLSGRDGPTFTASSSHTPTLDRTLGKDRRGRKSPKDPERKISEKVFPHSKKIFGISSKLSQAKGTPRSTRELVTWDDILCKMN